MMLNDYRRKAVLITGGTMGIGLATGLAFGQQGAEVYLTHRWGTADEERVREKFARVGAPKPAIIEADVSVGEDTTRVFEQINDAHERLEVFVSNVCVVPVTEGADSLSKRSLFKSLKYSAWPTVDYLQQSKKVLGSYPRYVIGTSTDGVDNYYQGYDYVAISKSVMEVFCRYLAKQLADDDVRVNMIRTRNVITESALAVHGADYPDFVRKYGGEKYFVEAEAVGNTIVALCSGLLDAMSGQIVNVDKGSAFQDNLMRLYRNREHYGL